MKKLSLAALMLIALSSNAIAAESVRLTDGRTLLLNEDGTYEWPNSDRAILVTLTNAGKAQGFIESLHGNPVSSGRGGSGCKIS